MALEPLPPAWLDRVFGRLALRYGNEWLRKWEAFDMAAVRADWAETLAGLQHRPTAIRYAFEHVHATKPPTAAEFKAIANRAPSEPQQRLEPPKPPINRERVAELRAKVGLAVQPIAREPSLQAGKTYQQRLVLAAVEARKKTEPQGPAPMRESPRIWSDPGPLPWPQGAPR